MGDVNQPSQRIRAYARSYGAMTAVTAVLMIIAVWAGSWVSAPLALAFVAFAYLWSLDLTRERTPAERAACRGCAAGCVGCRERIDAPAWPL